LPHFLQEPAETAGYAPPAQADPPGFADEWQVLWGTQLAEPAAPSGWPEIYEERGVRLALPHPLTGQAELPLRLRVRHYIDYDPATGLAYFSDLRLVELRDKARRPLGWL
jgi:CRISPR-associated protein (TIGR03984 family)